MSQADELLDSLTEEEISLYTSTPETEPHIVIGDDRYISVPAELQRIAVQYDHDVETVTFDCPRYWDGLDMSELSIYINYMRADKEVGCYKAKDITVDDADESIMHFTWTISSNVSQVKGNLKFLVCIKKADEDGYEQNHWNSEINEEMYISPGLEVNAETIVSPYPDLIAEWEEDVTNVKNILLAARDAGELDGATFTPTVTPNGYIMWTNDRGRENPQERKISPTIKVTEIENGNRVSITNDGSTQSFDIINGTNGTDAFVPTIAVTDIDGGHNIAITDVDGTKTFDVIDGVDGFTPTVQVLDIGGGAHRIIVQNKDGYTTADVENGKDGADGKDGTNGKDGADGYSPTITVVKSLETTGQNNYDITIKDKNGNQYVKLYDGYPPRISVTEYTDEYKVKIRDVDGDQEFTIHKGTDGTNGADGADGVSPTVAIADITNGHRVTITDKDGDKTFDVNNGADGADGVSPTVAVSETETGRQITITDKNGSNTYNILDGVSPTITVTDTETDRHVTITDKNGSNTYDLLNGEDGTDGVSPTVSVSEIDGGHRVAITDKDGTKTFDVSDGVDGESSINVVISDTEPTSGPVLWLDTAKVRA